MANTITYPSIPASGESRLLKIVSDGSNETLLSWDQSTNLLSSSHLTTRQLQILQSRLDSLIANSITDGDEATMTHLLQSMVAISDWMGVATPLGAVNAGVATVAITGMQNATTYYVVVSVPSSVGPAFGPAPL